MPKLRGYLYEVIETFPIEDGHGFRTLKTYDRLEDAEAIWSALESRNYDFSSHAIILIPMWEPEVPAEFKEFMKLVDKLQNHEDKKIPSDFITATGEIHDWDGWDANGSPTVEKS